MNDLSQFKQIYITECFELLADMEERLLALDCEKADKEQLNAIFRCAHSIKGGSGAFGLTYITDFTHVLEALLDSMREGKVAPSREVVDMLLKSVDIVTQMVHAARDNLTPPEHLGKELKVSLQEYANLTTPLSKPNLKNTVDESGGSHQYRIQFTPHESLFSTGNEPLLLLRELSRLGAADIQISTEHVPAFQELDPTLCYLSWTIGLHTNKPESAIKEVFEFVEDHCRLVIELLPDKSVSESAVSRDTAVSTTDEQSARTNVTTSIRVDLEKVDRLVNMVGELVITEAMLKAQTRDLPVDSFSGLIRGIEELSHHTRELQEAVMSVRMQPVKSIFSRMPRIVRDISTQLGKDIRLITSGENTEVDKTVIEQLGDPLTHMIRNSCDHGIEKPEIRKSKGKAEQGTIHLSADHRGGRIILEIRDDGAGINREKVLKKAIEKGLVTAGATLTDDEIDHLVFLPGFSTADVVSNVSGRGVGMDVVKRNIEGLGGTVRIYSEPQKGSLFRVSLPLTLAILDGMIVRVGADNYIIPITNIIETMRPNKEQVKRVEGHSDVINVRGEFVPVVYLSHIFQINNSVNDPSKALVLLVENGQEKMGLVVDELIGQQQVVIKSLEANSDPVDGISGATILGDGHVSLILDISGLVRMNQKSHSPFSLREAA